MSFGSVLFYCDHTQNSMSWAKRYIGRIPDGTLFLAGEHGHTRGRQSREWQQLEGQLLLTFALQPSLPNNVTIDQALIYLHMALTNGVLEALKPYGVSLKWPNDFVIAEQKMGGMLLETVFAGDNLVGMVLGIGLNIDSTSAQISKLACKATSLAIATGKQQDRAQVQNDICRSLTTWYDHWQEHAWAIIFDFWQAGQSYINKAITVHTKDGQLLRGTMQGVTKGGALVILDDAGKSREVPFYAVEQVN